MLTKWLRIFYHSSDGSDWTRLQRSMLKVSANRLLDCQTTLDMMEERNVGDYDGKKTTVGHTLRFRP